MCVCRIKIVIEFGEIFMKNYEVKFRYADIYNHWEWRTQSCSISAKDEFEARSKCIRFYGLGKDCDYEIISVKES